MFPSLYTDLNTADYLIFFNHYYFIFFALCCVYNTVRFRGVSLRTLLYCILCWFRFIDLIDETHMYTQLLAESSFLILHINVSRAFGLMFSLVCGVFNTVRFKCGCKKSIQTLTEVCQSVAILLLPCEKC